MAAKYVRPNNSIPLVVGGKYKIGNSERGGNWVIITHILQGYVHAAGVDNTIADLKVPVWKFDDLLADEYILPEGDA